MERKAIFFASPQDFRKWLMKNHDKETELLVGYYKISSGKPSITWSQSVDQAICFGWIDGVRRSIDSESYMIRFTPRKPTSNWSEVNIKKVAELTKLGLMTPPGIKAFNKGRIETRRAYSYEKNSYKLTPAFEKKFRANKNAYEYFKSLPPSYQRVTIKWIVSAKREETRQARFQTLVDDCAAGRKIKLVRDYSKK
ncbi:bacteriocin-protection protein [bacterium]|nr:bacteriocin-protection protein [bacterium]